MKAREDEAEYKETSDSKEDKVDLEGQMLLKGKKKKGSKVPAEGAKNLAEMSSSASA